MMLVDIKYFVIVIVFNNYLQKAHCIKKQVQIVIKTGKHLWLWDLGNLYCYNNIPFPSWIWVSVWYCYSRSVTCLVALDFHQIQKLAAYNLMTHRLLTVSFNNTHYSTKINKTKYKAMATGYKTLWHRQTYP